jgi:hypothetical protein
VLAGSWAAFHYAGLGLTLAHYDARAHLVVARRILDSLTPGWEQIGAVWLPLPHVLNMLPAQVDAWYRTGASAVAISVLSMGLAAGSLAAVILRTTGSVTAALTGAALLMVNPNILYLQSTPMTEPLLFGLTLFSVAATAAWLDRVRPSDSGGPVPAPAPPASVGTVVPGIALAGACMTRYEAWPITAVLLAMAAAVLLRRGASWTETLASVARLGAWPLVTIAVFTANSRWVVGQWFVSGGFFVPENIEALGHPLAACRQVREGLILLAGSTLPRAAFLGGLLIVWAWARSRRRAPLVLLLSLMAAAALPLSAYLQGHPFRIRYDAPLVIASAALAAAGIGILWPVVRIPLAIAVLVLTVRERPPLDRQAPLVLESQREAANMAGRRALTAYLQEHYRGEGILISMGSLGHYMHDLSLAGFDLEEFLHEGNGEIWGFAMLQPRGHAGWLIIEGSAEGGDALHQAASRPRWLNGFELVAEGGGARLYRAVER